MRSAAFVIAAALTAAMSGTATAQTSTVPVTAGETRSSWVASAYVGSNFHTTTDDFNLDEGASVDFGGQIAYLWKGLYGAEFIADFAPNVGTHLFLANEPDVNAYMVNAIAAIPLGTGGNYQPYISGGFGAIQLRADLFDVFGNTFSANESRFGGNIGGGLMAFADHIGIRADVRYYRASGNGDDLIVGDLLDQPFLSSLGFWRGTAGVAFRW